MWNRKREDEMAPQPAAQPAAPANSPRDAQPAALPSRSHDFDSGRSAAIGKSVVIKGQVISREDLYIDGEVEGSVEMPESRLTVGPNGRVKAGIKAREIVILGSINGNVDAGDKIDIRKDATLLGDIRTVRIVIEDGAFFKGSIDIVKPEPKPQARPAAAASAPTPAPAPAQPAAVEAKR